MNRTIKSVLCAVLSLVLVLSAVSAFAGAKGEKPEIITKASDFAIVIVAHDADMNEVELDWGSAVEAHDFADFEALRDDFIANSALTYEDIYGVEHGESVVENPNEEAEAEETTEAPTTTAVPTTAMPMTSEEAPVLP